MMREAKYVMDNGLLRLAHGIVLMNGQLGAGIYTGSYSRHHIHHPSLKRHTVPASAT